MWYWQEGRHPYYSSLAAGDGLVHLKLLDLGRAPYCYDLYGVKYIDLVSLAAGDGPVHLKF